MASKLQLHLSFHEYWLLNFLFLLLENDSVAAQNAALSLKSLSLTNASRSYMRQRNFCNGNTVPLPLFFFFLIIFPIEKLFELGREEFSSFFKPSEWV